MFSYEDLRSAGVQSPHSRNRFREKPPSSVYVQAQNISRILLCNSGAQRRTLICLLSPMDSILHFTTLIGSVPEQWIAHVKKIADDNIQSTTRERAVALHQAGKFAEAAAMYETLLRMEPANADLWWLLSIAQLRLDRTEEATASWRKCLSIETAVPLRLRNIANFLLTMQQKDAIEAQPMDFLDGLDIPDWPKDLPLDQDNQSLVLALGRCLTDFGHKEAALRLLDSILADLSGDPDFLVTVAPS